MPRILVSYRRADTAYLATTLHEKLVQAFGAENVFMDVDAIPAGRDFRKHLEQAVARCEVVLAVIGEHWLDARDADGSRRLDLPTDWVRIELETALARDIPVIPLLVAGAETPAEAELPEPLRELAYRQALLLRAGRDFQHDVDVLRREIERTCATEGDAERNRRVEEAEQQRAGAERQSKAPLPSWSRGLRLAAVALVLSAAVGMALVTVRRNRSEPSQTPMADVPEKPPPATPVTPSAAAPRPVDMVAVPAGPFFMGCNDKGDGSCDDEKAGSSVNVAAFRIGRTEVTVAQYRECVNAGKCPEPDTGAGETGCNWKKTDRDTHPINCVDWFQAKFYCEWAGKRLPAEAEWEKAARGTDARIYPWGNDWSEGKANVLSKGTVPVGSYPSGASPNGVLDMAGNVWEWVSDRGPGVRGLKGGSWNYPPNLARVAVRRSLDPRARHDDVGVRCAQ